jgi:hypothetical protein
VYSVYLCDALLNHPEYYNTIMPQLGDLRRVASCLVDLNEPTLVEREPAGRLLYTIIFYAQKNHELPDRKGVVDTAVELMSAGASSSHGDEVKAQLERMDLEMADARKPPVRDVPTNINVLIEKTIEVTRKYWHYQNGHSYSNMANGGVEMKGDDGEMRKSTPDDAISWMRKKWTKDLQKFTPRPAGFLDENTDYIEGEIERMKLADDSDRILTGLKHIDDCLVISKKLRPFIGIMGFANDGKTTLLRTMLYNMARSGKTVILFSKEEDPLDAWMSFAFLHSHHYRGEFTLPSLTDFQMRMVNDEDWEHLTHIINDIKNRKNIPGRIEVQRLTDWDTLIGHLKDNHRRVHYDVVAVDYLTRIDIPWGKPQFHNQNMATQIGMTQAFTRDFDGGEGMVFITPIQINRSGYQASQKKKDGEKKHNLTSVQQHSEFYQDMDFIISIFRDDLMKQGDTLLMEIQKVRGAAFPPSAILAVDAFSRTVCPPSEAVVGDRHFQDYLSGKVQSPVSKYMKEEVIQQGVFDSLDIAPTKA